VRPGQVDRQLDLDEGRRGRVHAPGDALQALRRGGDRDGVRREGTGGHVRAQDGDLQARLRPPRRQGRLPGRGHRVRREHLRDRDRHRGTQQLRGRLHRRGRVDQEEPAAREDVRRRLEREFLVPRQRPRARSDPHGLPVSRDQGRAHDGHRQRRHGWRVRRPRSRIARARRGRGPEPTRRRDRTHDRDRGHAQGRRQARGAEPRVARRAGREAPLACARARDHAVDRRGHRRSPREDRSGGRTADPGHRRPADGRHERRRRPVRRGQDVPAAGRQERARDEAGGRSPHPLYRSGEDRRRGARRRHAREGQDRHRDGEGRRARHRQEHRHGRPPVQQLRSREHGGDGPVFGHPREGEGRGRRHHRPVGPDHAESRRDGLRGARDAAR